MIKYYILFISLCIGCIACSNETPSYKKSGSKNKAKSKTVSSKNTDGAKIFKRLCVACHGIDGKLEMNGAKDFNKSTMSLEERKLIIANGKGLMTPFKEMLSPKEIEAVAAYTMKFKAK